MVKHKLRFLWFILIFLLAFLMACGLALPSTNPVLAPSPTRRVIALTPSPSLTTIQTPHRLETRQAMTQTALATSGLVLTGTITGTLSALSSQVSLDTEQAVTGTLTLTPTPTIVVNATLQSQYDSPFPLPGDEIQNFSKFGTVKISFQTNLSIEEVVTFYRGAFNMQRLVEDSYRTAITSDSLTLVFLGSSNGLLLYVEGKLPEEGLLEVSVYYGF